MDATNLAELYDLPTMDWDRIRAGLDAGFPQAPGAGGPNRHTCWLTTLGPGGGRLAVSGRQLRAGADGRVQRWRF
ncbi:hypothetical protein [Pseudonocardia sp. NPDC049154]|uniref:hypothetical protein n=1 Tax=Pseudonocardia sp. NPDC049154 TaxID=3155501 RepID=UPI0033FEDF56